MNASDQEQLDHFLGGSKSSAIDDLQGLLLQVSLAIMMIFMIAFFMFRAKTAREQQEQVMELNRQKLVLAADATADFYRARYGLTVLMPARADGARAFNAADVMTGDTLTAAPAARAAFADGARAAAADYADPAALRRTWRERVLAAAGLAATTLSSEDTAWLQSRLDADADGIRSDVRGVQRACAARLQRVWLAEPDRIGDPALARLAVSLKGASETTRLALAAEIADALRSRSLARLAELSGAPLLP